jgi:hypothetical protein
LDWPRFASTGLFTFTVTNTVANVTIGALSLDLGNLYSVAEIVTPTGPAWQSENAVPATVAYGRRRVLDFTLRPMLPSGAIASGQSATFTLRLGYTAASVRLQTSKFLTTADTFAGGLVVGMENGLTGDLGFAHFGSAIYRTSQQSAAVVYTPGSPIYCTVDGSVDVELTVDQDNTRWTYRIRNNATPLPECPAGVLGMDQVSLYLAIPVGEPIAVSCSEGTSFLYRTSVPNANIPYSLLHDLILTYAYCYTPDASHPLAPNGEPVTITLNTVASEPGVAVVYVDSLAVNYFLFNDLNAGFIGPVYRAPQPTCTIAFSQPVDTLTYAGGARSIAIQPNPGCQWSASTSSPWVHITSPTSETNASSVQYQVDRNTTGIFRSATISTNGGATLKIDQHAYRIDATLVPRELAPHVSGLPPSKTSMTIQVRDETGQPINGFDVRFDAHLVDAASAGHAHPNVSDVDPDLDAYFADAYCTTGSPADPGVCETQFQSQEVSGVYALRAYDVIAPAVFSESGLRVEWPGLQPLGTSASYDLVAGGLDLHPNGWYGQAAVVNELRLVAAQYFQATGQKLSFNDLSLVSGGLFDLGGNWTDTWGHQWHRVGCSVDVNHHGSLDGRPINEAALTGLMRESGYYRVREANIHFQRYVCPMQ